MSIGLVAAVVVILLVLTAAFQSPRLALIAVSGAPVVIVGVAVALRITGTTLNLQSFMGAIMALGDRHAAAVEPGDERRHRARRHERPGAGHVADRLRHRLRHVGAGMENELHDRHSLHRAALHVVDAADVEEVVLVVVGEQSLHLRRVHAAVGLADVDHRGVEVGKHVDPHPPDRDAGEKQQRDDADDDRPGAPQGGVDRIHTFCDAPRGRRAADDWTGPQGTG